MVWKSIRFSLNSNRTFDEHLKAGFKAKSSERHTILMMDSISIEGKLEIKFSKADDDLELLIQSALVSKSKEIWKSKRSIYEKNYDILIK